MNSERGIKMKKISLKKGRIILGEGTQGPALISRKAFMFAHGVNPKSGEVIDKKSDVYKKNIKDKVFIFPNGKGSTTGSMWFLETIRLGNAPKAIINEKSEMIIVTGAILGELIYKKKITIIDNINFDQIEEINEGDLVIIKNNEIFIKR